MLDRLTQAVLSHRVAAAVVLVGLLVVAGLGAARVRLDFSSRAFFGRDDALLAGLERFVATWGSDDDVMMVVVDAGGEDLVTPARIRALEETAAVLRARSDAARVRVVSSMPLRGPGVLPTTVAAAAASSGDAEQIARWREQVVVDAPWVPALLSADGTRAAIAVELTTSSDDLGEVVPVVAGLERALAAREGVEGLHYAVAGVPAIRAAFFGLALRDQMRFVPATLAIIGVALFVVFRSVHGVIVPTVAAMVPLLLLVGTMGWVGEPVGLLNQAYFTLIPVLAVADAIHMLARIHGECGPRPDRERLYGAIRRAVPRVGVACAFTSLTTAAGLVSLASANMPILRSFGLFAALGMVYAYAIVVVIVPLLVSASCAGAPRPAEANGGWGVACAAFATRRPAPVLAATAAVLALGVALGFRVEIDNHLTGLLDAGHPVREAGRTLDRELGGTLAVELDLAGPPGTFSDPAVLAAVGGFEEWARDRSDVRAVLGPAGPLASAAELVGAPGPPETRAGVEASYAALDLGDFVGDDRSRARVSVRVADRGGRVFEELADDLGAHARASLPQTVDVTVTGTPLLAYRGVNRITTDLRVSLAIAFVVVAAAIGVLFRSVTLALVCLVPNVLPLVVGYAAVGALGWTLDPLAGVILVLALAVAVDDSIHLLARIREESAAGRPLADAIHHAVRHSGRAVTITSVVLAAGLAIDLASSFPPLVMLGSLGALVILVALACDLVVLPALLVTFPGVLGARRRP